MIASAWVRDDSPSPDEGNALKLIRKHQNFAILSLSLRANPGANRSVLATRTFVKTARIARDKSRWYRKTTSSSASTTSILGIEALSARPYY